MRHCAAHLLLAAIGASCAQTKTGEKIAAVRQPEASRPSQVRQESGLKEEPLLLLDELPEPSVSGADNSRCHVCHLNFAQEALAVTHALAGLGCAKCHGPSDAHIADESWASGGNGTAPDVMFPREAIGPFCLGCHPKETIDADIHGRYLVAAGEEKRCTDCHGRHRLASRTCKWR